MIIKHSSRNKSENACRSIFSEKFTDEWYACGLSGSPGPMALMPRPFLCNKCRQPQNTKASGHTNLLPWRIYVMLLSNKKIVGT